MNNFFLFGFVAISNKMCKRRVSLRIGLIADMRAFCYCWFAYVGCCLGNNFSSPFFWVGVGIEGEGSILRN